MRVAAVLIACLVIALPAEAKPEPARFLGKDPHGPLAVATGRRLDSPPDAACRTWAKKGSRWATLDAFGRVVGKARVATLERYDVTNCDEVTLKTVAGSAGVGLYVTGDYEPAKIERWKLSGMAWRELEDSIAKRDRALPKSSLTAEDPPLRKRLLAWKTPSGDRFAVVGGRALSVLLRSKNAWLVVHRITPIKAELAHADMYLPIGVLDMNGDGRTEIVVHERYLDAYGDFTLTPVGGSYRLLPAGISGAFA
jgi:hypothetical protein